MKKILCLQNDWQTRFLLCNPTPSVRGISLKTYTCKPQVRKIRSIWTSDLQTWVGGGHRHIWAQDHPYNHKCTGLPLDLKSAEDISLKLVAISFNSYFVLTSMSVEVYVNPFCCIVAHFPQHQFSIKCSVPSGIAQSFSLSVSKTQSRDIRHADYKNIHYALPNGTFHPSFPNLQGWMTQVLPSYHHAITHVVNSS